MELSAVVDVLVASILTLPLVVIFVLCIEPHHTEAPMHGPNAVFFTIVTVLVACCSFHTPSYWPFVPSFGVVTVVYWLRYAYARAHPPAPDWRENRYPTCGIGGMSG